MPRQSCMRSLLAAAFVLPAAAAGASDFEIVPIALTGDVAPDMGGAVYDGFDGGWTGPIVNDAGLVGFQARFGAGPSLRALFVATPVGGSLFALEGGPAPGTGGTYQCMCNDGGVSFDGSNRLLFDAWVSSISGSVALQSSSSLATPLVQSGDPLPAPALSVGGARSVARRKGVLLFDAVTTGASVGLFREKDGVVSTLVLEGDPVPGVPGREFQFIVEGTRLAGPDASGRVGFGNYDGDFHESGVFLWSEDALTRVAYSGDPAPGTGANFASTTLSPDLNDAGAMVFTARLDDAGSTRGVFRYAQGTLAALVLGGQTAPGTGGKTFDLLGPAEIDDPGALLFLATLRDGAAAAGEGIFRLAEGAIEPVVLTGDVAPGTAGASFTDLSLSITPETALSASGDFLAFSASLSDGRGGIFRGSQNASVPALPRAGLLVLGLGLIVAGRLAARRGRLTRR